MDGEELQTNYPIHNRTFCSRLLLCLFVVSNGFMVPSIGI